MKEMKGFIIGPMELVAGVAVLAIGALLLLILSTTYAGIPGLEGLNQLLGSNETSADYQTTQQTTEIADEMITTLGETGPSVAEKEECERVWKGEFCPVDKPCHKDWGMEMESGAICCIKPEGGGTHCGESSASQSPAGMGANEGNTDMISLADGEGVGDVVSGGARLDCPKVKSHAQIEYEEDGWSDNVVFVFHIPFKANGFPDLQNAEWKWRGESTEVIWEFQSLGNFSSYRSTYSDDAFQEIVDRLTDVNANYTFMGKYYEGIKVFEDVVNTHKWAYNDDYIKLYYPDGRKLVTNTDDYDAFCLSDKVNSTALDFIRYEEDGYVPNVDYGYINREWKWKNVTENVFRPLSRFREEYEKTIHNDPAFIWLRDELIKVNKLTGNVNVFERGLNVFEKATLKAGEHGTGRYILFEESGAC
jgi:hypothetical protein